MAELKSFDSLMIVHAEDSHAIDHAPHPGGDQYATFLASRPRGAENKAIAEVIERARWTGARAHILHLSSSDALPMIATAKRDGVHLTVETCPHYLTLMAEEIPDGATAYKCCPPIREASNRELLWKGLQDGTIDCIVSDHSPSTLDLKDLENGDFAVAWGGVSSLQLGLSLIWTEARHRGIPLEQVVSWMAEKPAALARLANKGQLALGYDADFSVFAPDEAFVVDVSKLKHKNPITPYDGKALSGVVRKTFLRGHADRRPDPRRQAHPPRRRLRHHAMAVHVHSPARHMCDGAGQVRPRAQGPWPGRLGHPGRRPGHRRRRDGARRGTGAGACPEVCSGGGSPRLARRRSCNFRCPRCPAGGTDGAAGSGTQVPSSSVPEDSPEDDDGATPLPPLAGPVSLVAVDLAAGEVLLDGEPVALTGVEFKLLRYLVENLFAGHQPGRAAAVPGIVRFPRRGLPLHRCVRWPGAAEAARAAGMRSPRCAAAATSSSPAPQPQSAGRRNTASRARGCSSRNQLSQPVELCTAFVSNQTPEGSS